MLTVSILLFLCFLHYHCRVFPFLRCCSRAKFSHWKTHANSGSGNFLFTFLVVACCYAAAEHIWTIPPLIITETDGRESLSTRWGWAWVGAGEWYEKKMFIISHTTRNIFSCLTIKAGICVKCHNRSICWCLPHTKLTCASNPHFHVTLTYALHNIEYNKWGCCCIQSLC